MPYNNPKGPAALLAVLLLAACTAVAPTPEAAWLEDCPVPSPELQTNGDLAVGYVQRGLALAACNNDKAALRAWAEQLKKVN